MAETFGEVGLEASLHNNAFGVLGWVAVRPLRKTKSQNT